MTFAVYSLSRVRAGAESFSLWEVDYVPMGSERIMVTLYTCQSISQSTNQSINTTKHLGISTLDLPEHFDLMARGSYA